MSKWDSIIDGTIGIFIVGICIVAALFSVMLPTRQIAHYVDVNRCEQFAEVANRDTKFVHYTWWTWECLTPTEDGKWIPIDQLREFAS